jgi:hypothetical protein
MGARPVTLVGMRPRPRRPRTWTAREFVPSPQLALTPWLQLIPKAWASRVSDCRISSHASSGKCCCWFAPATRNHSVSLPINTGGHRAGDPFRLQQWETEADGRIREVLPRQPRANKHSRRSRPSSRRAARRLQSSCRRLLDLPRGVGNIDSRTNAYRHQKSISRSVGR